MKQLIALPAFSDNYVWMMHDGREALVVDPGEAAPVEQALRDRNLRLTTILVTHHHGDHVGGLGALRAMAPPCTVLRGRQSTGWMSATRRVTRSPGRTCPSP